MIDWVNSGLVIVRPLEGEGVTAIIYPQNKKGEEINKLFVNEEISSNVSSIIQKYNCLKKYDIKKCNSQHFVEDIFKAFRLDVPISRYGGPVGYYIKYISKNHPHILYWLIKILKF